MAGTSPDNAHLLDVLASLGADEGADHEPRPGTLGEGENGGKVGFFVDAEHLGVGRVGVGGAVGILEGDFEAIVTWKDLTAEWWKCTYAHARCINDAMHS